MDAKVSLMLILSLTGIICLLFLSQIIEPQLTTIAKATAQNHSFFSSNQEIRIIVNIISINQIKNSTTFFKLNDSSGIISGIIFNADSQILKLNKSLSYEVTGKTTEYENKTEIIISKINPLLDMKYRK